MTLIIPIWFITILQVIGVLIVLLLAGIGLLVVWYLAVKNSGSWWR